MSRGSPENTCVKDHTHWHFSARLLPLGRSSTDEDWEVLGRASQAAGVPEKAMGRAGESFEFVHPNAVQHVHWTEPDEECEMSETVAEVLGSLRAN